MKLSDVMSGTAGLSSYAEAALLVFVLVFVAVVIDLARSGRRYDGARMLPLEVDSKRSSRSRKPGAKP